MRATLIGATGLIGGHLLDLLLSEGHFDQVRILTRRPFEANHLNLEKCLVDFNDMQGFRKALEGSDVIFCSIGTTQKKVKGDKEAYRKVDYDITVNAAKFCKLNGCEDFVFVSAIGANSQSKNFYLRLKGEIEEAVKATGLGSVHCMQPAVLLGNRKEFRMGKKLAVWLMPLLSFRLPVKYKPINALDVAKAMLSAASNNRPGFFAWKYSEMKQSTKL